MKAEGPGFHEFREKAGWERLVWQFMEAEFWKMPEAEQAEHPAK